MAGSIFEVEPPRWLTAIAKPIDAKAAGQTIGAMTGGLINAAMNGQPVGESINDSFQAIADPLWQVHKAQANLNLEQAKMSLDFKKKILGDSIFDQQIGSQWYEQYSTPEARVNAPTPPFRTAQAWQAFNAGRANDVRLEVSKSHSASTTAVINDYKKRVDDLTALDPQSAAPFLSDLGKIPSDTKNVALNTALAAARLHKENESKLAEIQAISRGDVGRTTISDKGITTVYSPPKEGEKPTAFPEPKMIDGYLYYRNFAPKRLDNDTAKEVSRLNRKLIDARIKLDIAIKDPKNKGNLKIAQDTFDATEKQLEAIASGPSTKPITTAPNTTSSGKKYTIVPE